MKARAWTALKQSILIYYLSKKVPLFLMYLTRFNKFRKVPENPVNTTL